MTRESLIFKEKEKILNLSIEDKRKLYRCGSSYVTLDSIPTWAKMQTKFKREKSPESTFKPAPEFDRKISVWKGDITKLEIDAIANAANNSLLGGGGVDGAIHASAGSGLRAECVTLNGCDTGDAKITGGYNLPAKYVIHTVGPVGEKESKLRNCYSNCLTLLKENQLSMLAFPCISTGIFGYPNRPAAHVALGTVRKWMETEKNHELVDRIIFCMFQPADLAIYEELMQVYFPIVKDQEENHPAPPSETKSEKKEDEGAESVDKKETEETEEADDAPHKPEVNPEEKSPPPDSAETEKKT